MKLFLSSESVSPEQGPAFAELIGKPLTNVKIAYIGNASDVASGDISWIDENRTSFEALGCKVTQVDLRDYQDESAEVSLIDTLKPYDVIWLAGGNTYYLRWLLRKTGADAVITDWVKSGKVYGGASAGAIVAGPTINFFQDADDPKEAKEIILDGLLLTKIVVIPHWDADDYGSIMKEAEQKLKQAGYNTEHITNRQAIIINGEKMDIVPGYSDPSLIKKLGLSKSSNRVIINSPDRYPELLGEYYCQVRIGIKERFDWIQAFYIEKHQLETDFPLLKLSLIKSGQLWISWPKKAASLESDLNGDAVREIGLRHGLVDTKVIAIDEIWSGLKFVYRRNDRQE